MSMSCPLQKGPTGACAQPVQADAPSNPCLGQKQLQWCAQLCLIHAAQPMQQAVMDPCAQRRSVSPLFDMLDSSNLMA